MSADRNQAPAEGDGLPQLPKGVAFVDATETTSERGWLNAMAWAWDEMQIPLFTAEQMQAYARAALANMQAQVTVQTIKIGSYGQAFDLYGDRRAYTYKHQPGNVAAWRIGEASSRVEAGGDLIDRGLSLLKALEAGGFGVFELDKAALAAPNVQPKGTVPAKVVPYEPTQDMIHAVKRFDPALPLEHIRAVWWAMWGAAPAQAPAPAHGLLRMLADRARCFPRFPLGYHIPEVFAALGEEPPRPDAQPITAEVERAPTGHNRPPSGEPCNTDDWNSGYEAGLADGKAPPAPVAEPWPGYHDDIAAAIGELAHAMGSPTMMARRPASLLSATVRAAAERIKSQAPAVAHGWQPIQTAPKDGRLILVHFGSKGVRAVSWDSPFHDEITAENGIWCVDDDKHGPYGLRGYIDEGPTAPTHWMPLPAAPDSHVPAQGSGA